MVHSPGAYTLSASGLSAGFSSTEEHKDIHGLKVWYLANYFWSLECRRFVVDPVDEAARC
ncbi:hypothetical protein ACN28E_32205 [Archangium lansingense]|uniref:hypothetical protein n=1 Tax=Archangium lansingense TaxID=2995310 RepID=UPI003B82590A